MERTHTSILGRKSIDCGRWSARENSMSAQFTRNRLRSNRRIGETDHWWSLSIGGAFGIFLSAGLVLVFGGEERSFLVPRLTMIGSIFSMVTFFRARHTGMMNENQRRLAANQPYSSKSDPNN